MSEIRISAEQFRRDLTELLSQAGYGGATVVVERHGTPLAALIPYQEYQRRTAAQEYPLPEPGEQGQARVLREPTALYEAYPPQSSAGVLMIEEAAAYLRTSVETLKAEAERGEVPARKLGDGWRFSRQALEQWLQPQTSRQSLLAQAGIFATDRTLDDLIASTYQQRGHVEVEAEAITTRGL